MKATKRLFSAILASALLCGSVASVSAAEINDLSDATGGVTGSGAVEGFTSKDVLRVVLPTKKLDFIVDPQGLIKASGQTRYAKTARWDWTDGKGTTELNNGFVFFSEAGTETDEVTNKTIAVTKYSNKINLEVENKSSFKVDVTPSCKYTDGKIETVTGKDVDGVDIVETKNVGLTEKTFVTFTLYKPGGTTVAAKETLSDLNTYYNVVYDTKAGYKYVLNDTKYQEALEADTTGTIKNKSTITLVGTSLETANGWDSVIENMAVVAKPPKGTTVTKPSVEVTWTITKSTSK